MNNPAHLHDPISGRTQPVAVAWDNGFSPGLRIEDDTGNALNIPASEISFMRGGWRGDGVTFSWDREGRKWALTLTDPGTIKALAPHFPSEWSAQLAVWQKQNRRSNRWSSPVLVLGAVLALAPVVLLIALFLMRDRIIDIVIARIPKRVDAEIGERMHRQLAESGTLLSEGPAVEAVRSIGERLTSNVSEEEFKFRFEVVSDNSANAFAAPGGLVVVHTGLLSKTTSADQLAGVLSHEITHVTRRHSLRQILYDIGLKTTVQWVLGTPDEASVTIAGAAANLSGLKFSRDQETDADAGAIELLQKARLPATGLQSFFGALADESDGVPAFFSTHPADRERVQRLEQILAQNGAWSVEPLATDWEAVRRQAGAPMQSK